MSQIHYVERVPRRADFCGCPPCPVCYDPVITDDQRASTFQQTMLEIYGEGPRPQNPQEYEWAHVAAHQFRQELKVRPQGDVFEAEDRARMTQMQIDDLLKRAKKTAEAPKPLNRVNLDDMPAEAVIAQMTAKDVRLAQAKFKEQTAQINSYVNQQIASYDAAMGRLQAFQAYAPASSKSAR